MCTISARAVASRWRCTIRARRYTRVSIEGFARASFDYAVTRGWPLYFSTKNTILKAYDGYFVDIFSTIHENEFKAEFDKRGLTYEHRSSTTWSPAR